MDLLRKDNYYYSFINYTIMQTFNSRTTQILLLFSLIIILIITFVSVTYKVETPRKQPLRIVQNIVIDIVPSNIEKDMSYIIIQDKRSGQLNIESVGNEQLQYFKVGDTLQ
jgi:hypothetical protein